MAVALCEGKDTLDQVPRDESSGDDVYGQIASQGFESIAEDKDLSYIRNVSSDITYVMGLKPSDPNFEEETNIDAAMNGYNILMGNPNNAGDDPGMRHRIFNFMIANDRYLKGYTTREIAKGEQRERITHSTTADSYFKQLEKSQTTGSGITSGLDWDVAATVPFEGVEVSGSTTIPKFMDNKYGSSKASLDIEKSFTERQVSIHQSSQKYWEYAVELNPTDPPPFSQGFINTVRELHGAISGNEHDQKTAAHHLLDNYGTHFMLKTQMGRKATLMQKYSSSMAIKHTLKERNECTSKSFEFNLGGFIGIKKQSEDCKLSSEASGHFSSDDFVITTIYTTGEKKLPVPLEIKFSPILNLFSNLYMKDLKTENGNPIDYDGILTTFLSKIYIGACMRYINDEKQCKNGMKGCGWDDTCNRETETCQNIYDRNKQVIGSVCQHADINECATNNGRGPCKNDAVCTNTIGSFTCTCTTGWSGDLCDQALPCLGLEGRKVHIYNSYGYITRCYQCCSSVGDRTPHTMMMQSFPGVTSIWTLVPKDGKCALQADNGMYAVLCKGCISHPADKNANDHGVFLRSLDWPFGYALWEMNARGGGYSFRNSIERTYLSVCQWCITDSPNKNMVLAHDRSGDSSWKITMLVDV